MLLYVLIYAGRGERGETVDGMFRDLWRCDDRPPLTLSLSFEIRRIGRFEGVG